MQVPPAAPSASVRTTNAGAHQARRLDPPALTTFIVNTRTPEKLQQLVTRHGQDFNGIHVAAAIVHAAKLLSGQGPQQVAQHQQLLDQLEGMLARCLPEYQEPRQCANCVWALGKLGRLPRPELLAAVKGLLTRGGGAQLLRCKPQELSNLAYGLALLGVRDGALWDGIAAVAAKRADSFKAQELANVLWAHGAIGRRDTQLFDAAVRAAAARLQEFQVREVVNIVWSCAKVGHKDAAFLDEAAPWLADRVADFGSQDVGNLLWALGKLRPLGLAQAALVQGLGQQVVAQQEALVGQAKPQELVNVLWGCARLRHSPPPLLAALLDALTQRCKDLPPQSVANGLWACAALGQRHEAFLDAALAAATCHLHSAPGFKPQELSNVIWACGRLGLAAGSLKQAACFQALVSAAAPCLGSATMLPQHVANITWACAALRHREQALLSQLPAVLPRTADRLKPVELAMLSWSAARLQVDEPSVADALARGISAHAGQMQPKMLSFSVWSLAKLNHGPDPPLTAAAMAAAAPQLLHFRPRELANLAWGLALLGGSDKKFYRSVADALATCSQPQPPKSVAKYAWAFARAGAYRPALYDQLAGWALPQIGAFTTHDLCTMLWSFAVHQHLHAPFLEAATSAVTQRLHLFTPSDLSWVACAFARLNHRVPVVFDAILQSVQAQPALYDADRVSRLAWAFTKVEHPGREALLASLARLRRQQQEFAPIELQQPFFRAP